MGGSQDLERKIQQEGGGEGSEGHPPLVDQELGDEIMGQAQTGCKEHNTSVDLGRERNCHGTYKSESACTLGMNIVNSCCFFPECLLIHNFFNLQEYPTL